MQLLDPQGAQKGPKKVVEEVGDSWLLTSLKVDRRTHVGHFHLPCGVRTTRLQILRRLF